MIGPRVPGPRVPGPRVTGPRVIEVAAVPSVGALGPEWDRVFAAGPGLQSRSMWFAATEQAAIPGTARPCIVTVRQAGAPFALLPLLVDGSRLVTSLTSPYTTLFQPLLAPGADLGRAGAAFGSYLRRWPLARLDALDADWPGLDPLLAGLRRAGLFAGRFDHFGNWSESVAGQDWATYLAARPSALRETIRRRGAAARRDGTIRFEMIDSLDGLDRAIAAYTDVYARSWKEPEPYPGFDHTMLPMAARLGALRLALLWHGERPVAAQYWTVLDGVGTVLKLAHDDAARALSPGTLLTAWAIQRLLERDHVSTLDFGRGDDAYKQLWSGTRRQRIGLMIANPLRAAGALEVLRQAASRAQRAVRRVGAAAARPI